MNHFFNQIYPKKTKQRIKKWHTDNKYISKSTINLAENLKHPKHIFNNKSHKEIWKLLKRNGKTNGLRYEISCRRKKNSQKLCTKYNEKWMESDVMAST